LSWHLLGKHGAGKILGIGMEWVFKEYCMIFLTVVRFGSSPTLSLPFPSASSTVDGKIGKEK
jgi:hypothetical protein